MDQALGDSFRILNDQYVLGEVIGEGTFGVVCEGRMLFTQDRVAIKKITFPEDKIGVVMKEIEILRILDHPNIVKLHEAIEDKREGSYYLVFELAEGGELYDYIGNSGKLPEYEARRIMRQIISAVEYCHALLITHRDIKPENILLDSNMNVKLTDFGLANFLNPQRKFDTFCGSLPYTAPEILNGEEYIGSFVDIWSIGVILYCLVVGRHPWSADNPGGMLDLMLHIGLEIPMHVSEECVQLIVGMLEINYRKRYNLQQIRTCQWINIDNDELPPSYFETHEKLDWIDVSIIRQLKKIGFPNCDSEESQLEIMAGQDTQLVATYHLLKKRKENELIGKRKMTLPGNNPNMATAKKKRKHTFEKIFLSKSLNDEIKEKKEKEKEKKPKDKEKKKIKKDKHHKKKRMSKKKISK